MTARRPSTGQHGISQYSTSQTRARGFADEQPPPRIMIVNCPDLYRPELRGADASVPNPGDLGPARRLDQVIKVLTGFCPNVEVIEPGVCAFGARGPARYFGGETALAARIIAAVADLGVESRVGVADGLFAAFLAARTDPARTDPARTNPARAGSARAGSASSSHAIVVIPPGQSARFLAPQPVSVLADQALTGQDPAGQDPAGRDLAALLKRLGLDTLGDFAALPARDVASRFGDPGECAHRLARGLDFRPLAARPPPVDLSVTREFNPPEPRAEPVVFAAKTLAERLHADLAARGLTCVRVQVRATWADGRESSRLWRHDGLLSAAGVADRVRWQLDGWRPTLSEGAPTDRAPTDRAPGDGAPDAEQYPEGGVAALRLAPDQVVRAAGQQLALWGETVVSDRVARAAMRVQAMLGHEAVLRPVLGGGRDFGDQVTPVPFGEKREPRLAADQPWPGRVIGAAPGLVYPVAREAEVTDDAGAIVTVSGRCVVSAAPARLAVAGEPPRRVTGWAGPWPLSERWWDPAAARRRARFQLATDDGRAWLAVVQDGRWLIEAGYW
jgi:protein ImuB